MPHVAQQNPFTQRLVPCTLASAAMLLMLGAASAKDAGTPTPAATPATVPPAIIASDGRPQYWFGVAVENIPPGIAKQLKLKADQGVMVVAVFANSPAAKAGLRPDDLLIEINGKPLTSQEDLAKAANTVNTIKIGATKTPPPLMQISEITYLREGDHFSTHLTPESRPGDMLVGGDNLQRFTPPSPNGTANNGIRTPEVRNFILPNGSNVQYGPGYQVDANSQHNLKILQEAVGNDQSVIITQESDEAGNIKKTISDGTNTYVVEPGKLDQIPPKLRALAQQTLLQPQVAPASGMADKETTDDRLKRLEQQNEALKQQLDELKGLLLKATQPAAYPAPGK